MDILAKLQADIDARVSTIRSNHRDWQCRRGCANCCRRLAEIPRLTRAEWELLRQGLAALSHDQIDSIGSAIAALTEQKNRPIVCPFLDTATSSCQVYPFRPIVCRTYGFYVQGGKGLYCKDIEERVDGGNLNEVIWGNHDIIDHRLKELGGSRSLAEWFDCTRVTQKNNLDFD